MTQGAPTALGRYRIRRHLRSGGMAEIYLAVATGPAGFEREVVLKCVHQKHAANPTFVKMLIDEARIVARLRHGNIVPLFDFGEMEGRYFLAMEHVDGVDLARVLRRAELTGRPFPRAFALYIGAEVCRGLEHAHAAGDGQGRPLGIVHRDVSPSNVILTYEGEVRILDFGIAKAEQRLTETTLDVVKGKVHYMSPEQATQDSIDGRADLYSLGVVLFQMLAGRLPFEGSHSGALLERICSEEAPALAEVAPGIEPRVAEVVARALARLPRDRWQRAGDLADALSGLLHAQDPGFSPRRLAAYLLAEFPRREGVAERVAAQFALMPEPSLPGLEAPAETGTAEAAPVERQLPEGSEAAGAPEGADTGGEDEFSVTTDPDGPEGGAAEAGRVEPARGVSQGGPDAPSETPSAGELSVAVEWTRAERRRWAITAAFVAAGVALLAGVGLAFWEDEPDDSEAATSDDGERRHATAGGSSRSAAEPVSGGAAEDGSGRAAGRSGSGAPGSTGPIALPGTSVPATSPSATAASAPRAGAGDATARPAAGDRPKGPRKAPGAARPTAAPVTAAAAPASGAPPARGFLLVRVHPWAQVYVDGAFLGTAPMPAKELAAGPHTVRLVNAPLGRDETRKVTIVAGKTEPITLSWDD